MSHAVIIGSGGHCRPILSILFENNNYSTYEIIDIGNSPKRELIMGVEVTDAVDRIYCFAEDSSVDVFLAIGNNQKRRDWWNVARKLNLNTPNLISSDACVSRYAFLGVGNVVCPKAFIGPEVRIGNNVLINTGAIIEHESFIGDHCHIAPSSVILGRVRVDEECFIGAGATVTEGLNIFSGTTLGAGSVLIRDIKKSNHTFVGCPAREVI